MDGRLPLLAIWAVPGSLLAVGIGAFIRQQRAPSMLDRPSVPERYRVADDLHQPIVAVVAVAEQEATDAPTW
jgi:hypothetical protein